SSLSSTRSPPPDPSTLSLHDALPISARVNQPRPPSRACPFASDSGTKLAAPTSSGSPPPAAALDQAAARNSSVVATSSSARARRSEEHTSELQSRENLVCRLLLEKKK